MDDEINRNVVTTMLDYALVMNDVNLNFVHKQSELDLSEQHDKS